MEEKKEELAEVSVITRVLRDTRLRRKTSCMT